MKRVIIVLFTILCAWVVMPAAASAVDVLQPVCKNNAAPTVCKENQSGAAANPITGPDGILTRAMQILALVVGISAVITIVVAGLRMVLSGGDASKAETARRALTYAIAGLIIAALAQSLVLFVLSKL
ncbi:MAG TPA: hypothetical protein VJP80_07665 [Candidatus Saccharimonadales bacterium]|nr:hypothetical protein [Candidatus Saccharimonadales bacterium]